MRVRRDVKILNLFSKYAEKSQVLTSTRVVQWYMRCHHPDSVVDMMNMLRLLIEEKVIKTQCIECFLRKMLSACCIGVRV